MMTLYHISGVREPHGYPCLSLSLQVNVEKLVSHVVGVYADKESAFGDVAPGGSAQGQSVVLRLSRLQNKGNL